MTKNIITFQRSSREATMDEFASTRNYRKSKENIPTFPARDHGGVYEASRDHLRLHEKTLFRSYRCQVSPVSTEQEIRTGNVLDSSTRPGSRTSTARVGVRGHGGLIRSVDLEPFMKTSIYDSFTEP